MEGEFLNHTFGVDSYLHRMVTEDLKTPLIRILAQLELNKITGSTNSTEIELITEATLKLVDSYSLSVKLYNSQSSLLEEPVAIQSVIYDCQSSLRGFAKLQGVSTSLNIHRGTGLVVADRLVVKSIINCLAYSLLIVSGVEPKQTLSYSLAKSRDKINVGVYSSFNGFDQTSLTKLRNRYGRVKQALPELIQGATAGIVIADKLCDKLHTKLNVARCKNMTGLVFSLATSKQLSFV